MDWHVPGMVCKYPSSGRGGINMYRKVWYEGPDISAHQGYVDIKRIRDGGSRRIGLRVGYGRNNVDERYIVNAQACVNLGVDVLLYWFSYAYDTAMAAAEADYAIAWAAKYWKKCPIAFDFEYDSVNYARKRGVSVDRELATDMAISFLGHIRDAGYIPVLYANRDYLHHFFDLGRIRAAVGTVYLWYARYVPALLEGEAEDIDIWQYTSNGRMEGVTGRVDQNRFYTDFAGKDVEAGGQEPPNLNILAFQKAANQDGYRDQTGARLVEDGVDGPKTQYVRAQIQLRAKRSGKGYMAGSRGHLVRWWQRRCNEILGHNQEVDGRYGPRTRSETMIFQRRLSMKIDGIAGYDSIQAAFYN